jgi:sec-independent protein translocase protein TatA
MAGKLRALAGGWSATGGYAAHVNLGAPELLILLLIVLLIFGGAKLPKLARSLGQAQKEFKQGLAEGSKDDQKDGTAN